MLKYDKVEAQEVMNSLGKRSKPFVFLIDFEMEKILINENPNDTESLQFEMNGISNTDHHELPPIASFLEYYPIAKDVYREKFNLVKDEIQQGNSFLLNLSSPSKIVTNLNLHQIYKRTNAKYKVFLKDEFVCFSPEIFVKITDGQISSFPMKGTIDANIKNAASIILNDQKELAEHYTIVDLIRNDLSRVAKQVNVKRFRYIDKIKTAQKNLLQVSSEITGVLEEDYPSRIGDILFELLPAGSISGAPKVKTVEIIKAAEGEKRGYYTGICGYFDGNNLDSGVMIRFIEKSNGDLYYRSGGGITSMSNLDTEYQEMLDKVYLPLINQDPIQAIAKRNENNESYRTLN